MSDQPFGPPRPANPDPSGRSDLGAAMERIAARISDLAARVENVEAQLAAMSQPATPALTPYQRAKEARERLQPPPLPVQAAMANEGVVDKRAILSGLTTPTVPTTATPPQLPVFAPVAQHASESDTGFIPGPPPLPADLHGFAPDPESPATSPGVQSEDEPSRTRSIESMVGTKWAAIVGALFVVLAVGLFLKLGYDRQWFNLISIGMRCVLASMLGFALIGAGEWARRKINAFAAVGLFAAGVASVYYSVFAAYSFEVLNAATAFILLVGAAGLGIFIGARTKLASVAIVALVGGYAAPLLLENPDPSPLVLPLYLLMLLGVGLWLAAWRRGNFRWVGSVAWWGTLVLGAAWVGSSTNVPGIKAAINLGFLALAWGMIHLSHYVAARGETTGDPDEAPPLALEPVAAPRERIVSVGLNAGLPHLSSFSVTAWATILAVYVLDSSSLMPRFMAPTAMAGATLVLALVLAGNLRIFVDLPRTSRERLGVGLLMQCGALLFAAIALAVSGQVQSVVYLGAGVAAIVAGRWARSRGLEVYGVVAISIATLRVLTLDAFASGPFSNGTAYELLGLQLTPWAGLCAIAGAVWLGAGLLRLFNPGRDDDDAPPLEVKPEALTRISRFAAVASSIAVAMFLIATLHQEALASSIALAFVFIGAASVLGAGLERRLALDAPGLAATLLAGFVWLCAAIVLGWHHGSGPAGGFAWTGDQSWLFVHPAWLAGLLIGGVVIAASFLIRHRGEGASPAATVMAVVAPWLGGALVLLASSIEAGRIGIVLGGTESLGWAAVSVWWALFACAGTLVAGRFALSKLRVACAGLALASVLPWLGAFFHDGLRSWGDRPSLLHPGLLSAFALIAALVAMVWLLLRSLDTTDTSPAARMYREVIRHLAIAMVVLSVALLWVSTSMEVARAARAFVTDRNAQIGTVSTYWAIFAVTMVVIGFMRHVPWLRYAGLGLLALTAARILLTIFTSNIDALWRIVSVGVTGLLMLGVAAIYAKVTQSRRAGL